MPSLLDFLKGKIPEDLLSKVRRSYDIIGDIIVIDIPKELEPNEELIANALLSIHKNCKVVAKIISKTEGKFRVRRVRVIQGENRTYTLHKENGLIFYLDINKVFYTPRLATERRRIASMVKPGERVGDLFAGVGPYSILIAKTQEEAKVYAVDLNPYAFSFLMKNIRINKAYNVYAYLSDSRELVKHKFREFFDRVIMNIPKFSEEFLDIPFLALKNGGVCHYYDFAREDEFEKVIEKIKAYGEKHGRNVKILTLKRLNEIAPREYRVVVDFEVI